MKPKILEITGESETGFRGRKFRSRSVDAKKRGSRRGEVVHTGWAASFATPAMGGAETGDATRARSAIGTEDLLGALLESRGRPADILCNAILSASQEKTYPLYCASEILKQIGDIFLENEDYPKA